jgi:hypothetical protein
MMLESDGRGIGGKVIVSESNEHGVGESRS